MLHVLTVRYAESGWIVVDVATERGPYKDVQMAVQVAATLAKWMQTRGQGPTIVVEDRRGSAALEWPSRRAAAA